MESVDKENYLQEIKKIKIFRHLDDEEIKKLLSVSDIVLYEKGSKIVSEGEISPYFYAVIEGTVNVCVKKPGGNDTFICAIGEGDVFGEAGIFLKVKRTANIISADGTIILQINRKDMFTFICSNKNTGMKILMLIIYSMLKKLRDANQELAYERDVDINQDDIDSMIDELVAGG